MIAEMVRFPAPKGAKRADLVAGARHVVPKWQANPDLLRKNFLWSEDGEWLIGFYFWKSRAAAERAHDAAFRADVKARSGKEPEISYFETFMVIDNEAGRVIEPEPSEPARQAAE